MSEENPDQSEPHFHISLDDRSVVIPIGSAGIVDRLA
jgi:hypothetical protein